MPKQSLSTSAELTAINRLNELSTTLSRSVSPDDKTILHYDFSQFSELLLVPLYDVHVGMAQAKLDLLEELCGLLLSIPNAYVILGGDLMEAATKDAPGNAAYAQVKRIQEQVDYLQDVLAPLAKAGRILVGVPGNHERRLTKSVDHDPMATVAKALGFPYEMGGQGYLRLHVGQCEYLILVFHGRGAAQTPAARVAAALRLRDVWPDAHIYIVGHSHQPFMVKPGWSKVGPDGRLMMQYQYVVSVPSFVEYFGSYAEQNAAMPVPVGTSYLRLGGTTPRVEVHL